MSINIEEGQSQGDGIKSTIPKAIPAIDPQQYRYHLPDDRIAQFPLEQRDGSKLLIAHPRALTIRHDNFYRLSEYIPEHSLFVRNDTKVITARLLAKKPTGGAVEILLLTPQYGSPQDAMMHRHSTTWYCMIGGRNIKEGMVLSIESDDKTFLMQATIITRNGQEALVTLSWSPPMYVFAAVLDVCGTTPLPPYMHRVATHDDKERYQTVYAVAEGSVAAPTAGLHFTERVFDSLREKYCAFADITLHVGLGTFKPITTDSLENFTMHNERFEVSLRSLKKLRKSLEQQRTIVGVGTTSMRTIESLYWYGVSLLRKERQYAPEIPAFVSQWEPYALAVHERPHPHEVFVALEQLLESHQQQSIVGTTEIIIVPGYHSMIFDALITNFHQPESTLMLLVAAFVGEYWREIYQTAIEQEYRFLSYGDSSLLFKHS